MCTVRKYKNIKYKTVLHPVGHVCLDDDEWEMQ